MKKYQRICLILILVILISIIIYRGCLLKKENITPNIEEQSQSETEKEPKRESIASTKYKVELDNNINLIRSTTYQENVHMIKVEHYLIKCNETNCLGNDKTKLPKYRLEQKIYLDD